MTSYIQTNEAWVHESSVKALETLRLLWTAKVDAWVVRMNSERSKASAWNLWNPPKYTNDQKVIEDFAWDTCRGISPRHNLTLAKDESRLLALIKGTEATSKNQCNLSIEDSCLINTYLGG